MDVSLTDNADLNRERDKAEQEKRKIAEELEKPKLSMSKLSLAKAVKSAWK